MSLSIGVAFLLVRSDVGGLTGLILGLLLQTLAIAATAHAAFVLDRAFPLSEPARTSRRVLLGGAVGVLPAGALLALLWTVYAVRSSPLLFPALPLFWGPLSASAALGLVFAARELASERMAVVAALGAGGVVAMALSAGSSSLIDPVRTLTNAGLAADLFLMGLGFLAIAAAFEWDAWTVRARRAP